MHISSFNDNYIVDNWIKFITLTDQEMYNLQCIINSQKKDKKDNIVCNETNEIFPSIDNLATKLQINKRTLIKYIKLNARYWGKNKEYHGKTFDYF